ERVARELVEVALRQRVLVLEAERCQVARADDDVRVDVVALVDRPFHQGWHEVGPSAVDVGDLRDRERPAVAALRHARSVDPRHQDVSARSPPCAVGSPARWRRVLPMRPQLLCELHAHTTFSDGLLTPGELVDLYGSTGFDVLAITDHICSSTARTRSIP